MKKIISCFFFLIVVSCHLELDSISIIFESTDNILLIINADEGVKYYQKKGRIKGISINSEQLSVIEKNINKIKFISIKFNNKKVYRAKWFTIPNPNIIGTERASIFQSTDGSQSVILIFCDDNAIKFTNCLVENKLNNILFNYIKKRNQLYAFDKSEIKNFKRIDYMKLIRKK